MAKKKELNPYINSSIEDVEHAEANSYVIQVGGDLFSYNGHMAFTKEKAEKFYQQVWDGLIDMSKTGDEIEKEDAVKCLILLKLMPLRIH